MEPDKGTPEFLTEIILTHMVTHYDNYENIVSYFLLEPHICSILMLILQNIENTTLFQRILNSSTHHRQNIANHVLNILTEILNKRYPKVEDITESKLMEWKMWPSFLGMIGKYKT